MQRSRAPKTIKYCDIGAGFIISEKFSTMISLKVETAISNFTFFCCQLVCTLKALRAFLRILSPEGRSDRLCEEHSHPAGPSDSPPSNAHPKEIIFIKLMTSDRKLKASKEGSTCPTPSLFNPNGSLHGSSQPQNRQPKSLDLQSGGSNPRQRAEGPSHQRLTWILTRQ